MACDRRAHSAQWKPSESAASKALAPPRVFIVSVPAERLDNVRGDLVALDRIGQRPQRLLGGLG
jgi:hypothetical protein